MEIYLYIVAAVLIFGLLMPQKGPERKYYIALMTVIHAFVCGLRYQFLTGDLHKYYYTFLNSGTYGWFSEELLAEGRNTGFMFLNKLVNLLSGGNFQIFLIVIAVVTHVILGYVIYRYSTAPWLSYLIWNCMTFYVFGFSAIKQALAMSFVLLAFVGVAERNLKLYLVAMALAGAFHVPALIFLPSYWIASQKVDLLTLIVYAIAGTVLYIFRNQFLELIMSFYYEDDDLGFVYSGEIGSRFIMILGFALFSLLLTGLPDRDYGKLFHLMAIAAILQMLAGFNNIFTRLADYYYQFSVLYLPMLFFPKRDKPQKCLIRPAFPFNQRSLKFFSIVLVAFLLWYYYALCLSTTIAYETDNYLNFRFMWDVK